MAKSKPSRITGAHRLIWDSLRFMRAHWKILGKLLAVAAVINLIISLGLSSEAVGLYQSIWFVIISCVVIWAIRHAEDKQVNVSLAKAYYVGSAPALRFFLTLISVALTTLPFSIGAFVYGVVSAVAAGSTTIEQILAGGLWLVMALITLVLLARTVFSLLIITLPDIRPLQAMQMSWRLARGRANAIMGRLGIFIVYLAVASLLVILGLSYLPISPSVANVIVNLLGSLLVLPIVFIYLFKLYQAAK